MHLGLRVEVVLAARLRGFYSLNIVLNEYLYMDKMDVNKIDRECT